MTTSAVYDLIPNEDGGQNTRYPLGDKPAPELAPPIPNNLATGGETLTSVDLSWGQTGDGHTKFVLQRWRINTDTAWTLITEPGKDTRNYTDSADLLEGQHVGYRIASSDGVNQSDWAPEAWTYVLSEYVPPVDGVLLYDDFSSYAVGSTLNNKVPPVAAAGVKWSYTKADYSEDHPVIVSGGYGGDSRALGFRFNPRLNDANEDYAYSEQRYYLCNSANTALKEIWVEYYVYWPTNFATKTLAAKDNNKCFDLISEQFGQIVSTHYGGDFWSDSEMWPNGGDKDVMVMTQNLSMGRDGSRQNWGHAMSDWATPPYNRSTWDGANQFNPIGSSSASMAFWSKALDPGNWRRYRFHCKAATAKGVYDAIYEVWKDNTKIVELKDVDFVDDTVQGFDSGYIFGWQNTGVTESCVVKLSRATMWATDPQWSF